MSKLHVAYLSLGSNIESEINLPRATQLLAQRGQIVEISSIWESQPVGGGGDNYLNACLSYQAPFSRDELKSDVIQFIETKLERRRSRDKYAPRTIDIDIIVFDDEIVNGRWLRQAFVVAPLAEIYPTLQNPETGETIAETATRLRRHIWMKPHQELSLRS
jgi:2-amino-4-hydroxy-6-hydroxymethyldihydropteridine diphosphokinase